MTNYNGFDIDPSTFQIYKNGREVKFPQSYCLESAKATIDASNRLKAMPSVGHYSLMLLLDEDDQYERDLQDFVERSNNYHESLNEPDL